MTYLGTCQRDAVGRRTSASLQGLHGGEEEQRAFGTSSWLSVLALFDRYWRGTSVEQEPEEHPLKSVDDNWDGLGRACN